LIGYSRSMIRLLAKIALLLSVLMLPFGMGTAAAAAPMTEHHAAMMMPMGHCPEPAPGHRPTGVAECTMACAAALPALDRPPLTRFRPLERRFTRAALPALTGVVTETATPPPKTA